MARGPDDRRSSCPLSFALDIFGDRWSLLVLRDLAFGGKRRYCELLRSDEGIATNILAERLERLEAHGILEKSRDPEDGRRRLYSLTSKGKDLIPVLAEIMRWAARHDPQQDEG